VKRAIKALVTSYSINDSGSQSFSKTLCAQVPVQVACSKHAEINLFVTNEEIQSFPLQSLQAAEVYLVDKKHYEDLLKRGQRLKNPIMAEYEEFN
jgi:hypothetical protein